MTDAGSGRSLDAGSALLLDEAVTRTPAIGLSAPEAVRSGALRTRLPVVPLAVLATVPLLSSIVSVAYLPALPAIARSYHASAALLGWSVSVPALVGAAGFPLGGKLGDLYGRRRVLLALLGLFTAGSACLVVFHSDATLLIGRSAQAATTAAAPLSVALITELVGIQRRAEVLPRIVAIVGAGFGLGFLGSTLVVEHLGLSALSAGLAALGAIVIAAVVAIVRTPRTARRQGRVDWIGAVLLCAPIGMLLLALGQAASWGWSSRQIIALLVGAPLLLILFAIRQRTAADPMIPPGLLARREAPVTYVLAMLVGLALVSLYILLPELLEASASVGGFALPASEAGLVLAITSLAFLLGGIVGKALITRLGVPRATAAAMALAVCGYAALAIERATVPATAVSASVTFLGISLGIAAVTYGIAQAAAPSTVATALALTETAIAIGNAVGAQLLATVVAHVGTVGGLPSHDAYTAGFGVAAALALCASLAGVAAARVLRRS
jgi:MFS family permease